MRDVIIIGSGGGGGVMAKELAQRGLDVLLLEAGGRNENTEADWSHFEADQTDYTSGQIRWGPSDRSKPMWYRETVGPGFAIQNAGVGGTTQQYFGYCPRAMPGVFTGYSGPDADAYDTAHRFPFTYESLIPYYEWVEATLPVQTAAMGRKDELFFAGAEGIGLPFNTSKNITKDSFRPQENSILQPGGNAGLTTDDEALRYPAASGCTLCGYCWQGCTQPKAAPVNLKAKRGTNYSYVPMALTASKWSRNGKDIELLADAFVTRIHTVNDAGQARVSGVSWRDTRSGETFTEDATVVVLSAGVVESPRLWLNSGLPNPNDWVGRGMTDHYFDLLVGVMPFDAGGWKGPGSSARADFPGHGMLENFAYGPAMQASIASISNSGTAGHYNRGQMDASGADTLGRLMGNQLGELMAQAGNLMMILASTDDDVDPSHRVTLTTTFGSDEHGVMPRIEAPGRNRSARTEANRKFLAKRGVELLRAAGALSVHRIDWWPIYLHIQSSMRMGLDESDSVCSEDGQSRAVAGLYVADNSVLANSLGGPNPTLTTQAIATRTAENIFRDQFGGEAWVSRESPITSIDDRVTRAVMNGSPGMGRRRNSSGGCTVADNSSPDATLTGLAAGAAIEITRRQLLAYRSREELN